MRQGSEPRGVFRSGTRQALARQLVWMLGSWLLIGSVQAGTVVTNYLISQSSQTQTNIPVTFGQIFKDGDVPQGATVSATLNGQPLNLQVNVKATNPDGSLRHAVLTALIPSIAGNAAEPLVISSASPSTQASPVTLAELLATSYDASASLNIGGTMYTADARALLQAANVNNACKPWGLQCNVWLSGSLVSEWIVGGPLKTSSGSINSNLYVYFNVRAYSGASPGTVAYVRTNIVVENAWAYTPQMQSQYTATLVSGTASYTSPTLTQYAYTRWHEILWWNGNQPSVYVQEDTQYIQSTGAVSRYEVLQPDDAFLNKVRQFCPPLNNCDQTKQMSTVGAQPAIGPLPQWTSTYIIDPDIRAYNWMLADDDAIGAYSIHFRDQSTGQPLSIVAHPYVTIAAWNNAYTMAPGNPSTWGKDLLPNCTNDSVVSNCTVSWFGTGNPYGFDNEHDPSIGYVPYMVTGSFYYLEELEFTASYLELWANPVYRGYSQGLMWNAESAPRAKAWDIRNVGDAAYLTPDNAPLKSEFEADLTNIVQEFTQQTVNNPNANPLHLVTNWNYTVNGVPNSGAALWQDSFLTWLTGHLTEQGVPGASALRDWKAAFEIGLMTDWMNNLTYGYCWLEASSYAPQFRDANGVQYTSFSQVYQVNFPTLYGLECNGSAMIAALSASSGQSWQVGEMVGYPGSATGFPANMQVGIAMAADSSLAKSRSAWETFQNRSVQPSGSLAYDDIPQFAVLPRYLPYVPIVNIYASPNPITTAGGSTTLYWNTSDATSCSATWTSSTASSGQASVGPINNTAAYPISCTGSNGTTNAAVTVSVASATPAPPDQTTSTPTSTPAGKGAGGLGWLTLLLLSVCVAVTRLPKLWRTDTQSNLKSAGIPVQS